MTLCNSPFNQMLSFRNHFRFDLMSSTSPNASMNVSVNISTIGFTNLFTKFVIQTGDEIGWFEGSMSAPLNLLWSLCAPPKSTTEMVL